MDVQMGLAGGDAATRLDELGAFAVTAELRVRAIDRQGAELLAQHALDALGQQLGQLGLGYALLRVQAIEP